ncbi:MAG: chemotaxis protein CheR [Burkholderiales bacterium]|nr:chemotaxis protein CheR [Burkholderiales bacterium]
MGSGREFAFTDQDFARVRKLLYERAGISLSPIKKYLVYSRLSRRLRATGFTTFEAYLSRAEKDAEEMEAFTNALTTNLTSFFREEHHFPILADHVAKFAGKRPVSLWCSACSTGEEAYSMAMTMADLYGDFTSQVKILATDIDTNVLEQAEKGVYPIERIEKLDPALVKRFFLRGSGKMQGQVMVKRALRDMITFDRLNLLDDNWPMKGHFDAIFCRNVMIYFDKATQYRILKKFVPLLQPDGLLFAGHSENFYQAVDLFKSLGKTVYRISPEAMRQQERAG